MPSIRYYNQTAPFWDFVASLEEKGPEHPMFAFFNEQGPPRGPPPFDAGDHPHGPPGGPQGEHGPFGPEHHHRHPFGGRRGGWGGRGGHHHHGRGGFGGFYPPPPPPPPGFMNESDEEGRGRPPFPPTEACEDSDDVTMNEEGEGPKDGPREGHGHGHRHGRRHGGARGRCGGRGGFRGWGGRHGAAPFVAPIVEFLQTQLGDAAAQSKEGKEQKDFTPEVDVFDTEEAYIVHASLPGAKKEDVGVNWNADKSELAIAGVIHRPGDEEFLKTLAMDERKVGVFERSVRLGSRTNPAQVDVDGINAKLEDGILSVTIPKLDKDDFVEVKRVDIE